MATFKSLTKKEMKHLKSQEITTLRDFKQNTIAQAKMRLENHKIEPCYECKNIARKLELGV